jgi:hypothetical protein
LPSHSARSFALPWDDAGTGLLKPKIYKKTARHLDAGSWNHRSVRGQHADVRLYPDRKCECRQRRAILRKDLAEEASSTTKTYVEKFVGGLKAKTDLPLFIEVGQPIAGLEIGFFIDSRNQIKEQMKRTAEKFPDGGTGGYMPCKDF